MDNKKVVLVTDSDGFLVKSLEQSLIDNGFDTRMITFNIDKLHNLEKEIEGVVLFIESVDISNTFLMYLKDVMTDKGLYACLVGEKVEINEAVSRLSGCRTVLAPRPIDVKDIIKKVKELHGEYLHNEEKKKILVIDDDPMFLKRMKGMLKNAYNVYVANSGASAIMVLGKHDVDLILLDYEMPVVKGPQVMQMLKLEPAFASIPVMFMTGMNDVEHVRTALELGPVNYIIKTQDADQVFSVIGAFFEGNKMPSQYKVK